MSNVETPSEHYNKFLVDKITSYLTGLESETISQNDCKAFLLSESKENVSENEIDSFLFSLFKSESSISKIELTQRLHNKTKTNSQTSVQESNEGESIVLPTNKIEIPFLSQRGKTKQESGFQFQNSTTKKINRLYFSTINADSNNKNELRKSNNTIIQMMNQFKKEFFNPINKIPTSTKVQKPLYASINFPSNSKKNNRYEEKDENTPNTFEQKEYIFETKKYDLKDPKQKEEYINYIKSDLQNFNSKKKQKLNEKKEKPDPFESVNLLMNKISSHNK